MWALVDWLCAVIGRGFSYALPPAALKLRAYRKTSHSNPLVDIKHVRDTTVRRLLSQSSQTLFSNPRSMPDAVGVFMSLATPRFILCMIVGCGMWRVRTDVPFGIDDAQLSLGASTFWIMHEWFAHEYLFHRGRGWAAQMHQFHHDLPYYHVSVDAPMFAVLWFVVASSVCTWFISMTHLRLTAITTYACMGLMYEFTHFISHTRVPLKGFLAHRRRHHMRHHFINDAYWLAFTAPCVDDWLRPPPY